FVPTLAVLVILPSTPISFGRASQPLNTSLVPTGRGYGQVVPLDETWPPPSPEANRTLRVEVRAADDGRPLPEAQVEMITWRTGLPREITADESGLATLQNLDARDWAFHVTAPGYVKELRVVSLSLVSE